VTENGVSKNDTAAVWFALRFPEAHVFHVCFAPTLLVVAQSRIVGKSDAPQKLPSIVFYDQVVLV
jgi:hypothetical protein